MSTLLILPGRAAAGTAPVGTWLKIPAIESAEIMAFAGFDFVIVDLEHAPLTLETAYRLINISALSGVSPLVRVPDKTAATIQRVLDANAHGILVPHIDTVEEARSVVRAVRFPVGAENRVTSCDLQVLVDEASEPVTSEHADGRPRTWWGAACGRAPIE